jgi:hypothetical protein
MKNEMRLQGIGLVEGTEAGKIQVGDILRWNHGGLSRVVSFELTKTGKTIICQVEVINSRTGEKEMYERKMRTSRLVNIVASANTNNDFNLQFDPIEEEAPEAEEVQAVEKVSFTELEKRTDWKEAVVVFSQNGSYSILSTEKYFNPSMNGSSLYGYSLEGEEEIRLDSDMLYDCEIDYCYITEFKEDILKIQIEEATEADLKKSVHEVAYRITNHGSYVEVMLFVTDIANDVTLVAQQEGEFDSMEEAETLISYLKKTGNKIEFVETMAYTG